MGGRVLGGTRVREDPQAGLGEAQAVDEARVVERIAADAIGRIEESREHADVELEAAREEDGILGADEGGEASLDAAMRGEVTADEARGGSAARSVGLDVAQERRVGEAEVVVAAEADDGVAVEAVADAVAVVDLRQAALETAGTEVVETATQAIVEGHAGGVYRSWQDGGVIEEELGPWVERHGWNPGADAYARLAVLVDLWLRYGAAMNLHGARTRGDLVRHVQDGLETALVAGRALAIAAETTWLDVGSGGGFPALVVAATLPCRVVAVEPRQKRASFLELAFGAIECGSSRVVRARYGDPTWEESVLGGVVTGSHSAFSIASARAVWPPAEWLEVGKRIVAAPGIVVVHGAIDAKFEARIEGTFGPITACRGG